MEKELLKLWNEYDTWIISWQKKEDIDYRYITPLYHQMLYFFKWLERGKKLELEDVYD